MSGNQDDQYTNAINALARRARMPQASVERLERELLDAFTEHHGDIRPLRVIGPSGWRSWLAAAAALITIAGSIEVWRFQSDVTVNNVTKTPAVQTSPVKPASSVATNTPAGSAAMTSKSTPPHHHTPSGRRAGSPGIVKPVGFVELPNAAGLPEFESGTIVRLELPVASLPAYGIEIPGAADERPVEADLLVGQDGAVRAIRLVTKSNDATGARDSHGKQE